MICLISQTSSTLDMRQFITFLLRLVAILLSCSKISGDFDVTRYGAKGDGKSYDSKSELRTAMEIQCKAFEKAWQDTCGAKSGSPTLRIPSGTYLLQPLTFQGPCLSDGIRVVVEGTLVAPEDISEWAGFNRDIWLMFVNVDGLLIYGNGLIDGRGFNWWKACPVLHPNCMRPTALGFYKCDNLEVHGLKHKDSAKNHISISDCQNVTLSSLQINAPETSPNTDGIDISQSSFVYVHDCNIGTGDDCIAMGPGTRNVNITGITCGPGHGISIGSLGRYGSTAQVEEIHVSNCIFSGTENGARIKTFRGGKGYARKIFFYNMTLNDVQNPIIINQFYCDPQFKFCDATYDIEVSEVSYTGFQGTSFRPDAITLNCSDIVGCTGIDIQHSDIVANSKGKSTYSVCHNAHGKSIDTYPPINCLKS